MNVFETERLTMRELEAADAPFMLDILNQPSFIEFIGDRGVRDIEQAENYIETRFIKSYRDNGFGMYIVEIKEDGPPAGICGLIKRDTLPDPDIGFAFLPQYWKLGYAYESAKAILDDAVSNKGFRRILAIATQDNESSCRLLEKLGLKFERLTEGTGNEPPLKLYAINSSQAG